MLDDAKHQNPSLEGVGRAAHAALPCCQSSPTEEATDRTPCSSGSGTDWCYHQAVPRTGRAVSAGPGGLVLALAFVAPAPRTCRTEESVSAAAASPGAEALAAPGS